MGKIIAFYSRALGATSTSINLGACLAEQGKKVLIVDIDYQGDASCILATTKEKLTIVNVLHDEIEPSVAIKTTRVKNLFILPSSKDLENIDKEWESIKDREFVLRKYLEKIRDQYDYIFIDCPASYLGLLTVNAFAASDSVITVMEGVYFDEYTVTYLVRIFSFVKKQLNPKFVFEVVLNKSCAQTSILEDGYVKLLGDNVYSTRIPKNIHIPEASNHGMSVCHYKPKCKATKAYRELAAEFLERNK